jgi:hypothetical protein
MSSMSRLFKTIVDAASSRSERGASGRQGGGRDWRAIAHTVAQKVQEKTAPGEQPGGGARDARPEQERGGDPGTRTARPADLGGARTGDPAVPSGQRAGGAPAEEERALAKYEYLTRTAPPEKLERVNRDAFDRLSPEQREEVRSRFDAEFPAAERPASSRPEDLARSATRAEVMKPGLIQRVLGGGGPGASSGGRGRGLGAAAAGVGIGAAGGGLLAAVAGGAVLSAAAGPLLEGLQGLEAPEEIAELGQMAEGADVEGMLGGFGLDRLGELGSPWGIDGNPFE